MYRAIPIKYILFLGIFTACATQEKKPIADDTGIEFSVEVNNPTAFDVCIEGNQVVKARSGKNTIILRNQGEELTRGFDIIYEIKLSNSVVIYCKGDNQKLGKNDTSLKIELPDISQYYNACFIKITNKANNAVSLYNRNQPLNTWEQTGSFTQGDHLRPSRKIEFSQNETVVFNITENSSFDAPNDNHSIRDGRTNIPLRLPKLQRNYIYEFEYTSNGVLLVDARPLHCIGEPTWSRKLDGANLPVFTEFADRSIKVAIPSNSGVDFITLNAEGEEIKKKKTDNDYGGNAVLSTMLNVDENNYFFAIYRTRPSLQFLVKQNSDDGLSWRLPFRQKMGGYKLNTVIPKEGNTYLVAGTADDSAYMLEIEVGKSEPVWEFLVSDANKNWKTVQSAAYDAKSNIYIITGIYGGSDRSGEQKAFIGFVEQNGTTGKIKNEIRLKDDKTTDSIIINQVLCDSGGNIYVAGRVLRERIWYAVVQKYNSEGEEQWSEAKELEANSLYRCAALDEENGQIVLGGAMKTDRSGNMGTPFLQGIDSANGNGLWIEDISPISKELDCVTGLQKAKNYGYIAALSGISGENKIFILARLNSRGKILANHKIF